MIKIQACVLLITQFRQNLKNKDRRFTTNYNFFCQLFILLKWKPKEHTWLWLYQQSPNKYTIKKIKHKAFPKVGNIIIFFAMCRILECVKTRWSTRVPHARGSLLRWLWDCWRLGLRNCSHLCLLREFPITSSSNPPPKPSFIAGISSSLIDKFLENSNLIQRKLFIGPSKRCRFY